MRSEAEIPAPPEAPTAPPRLIERVRARPWRFVPWALMVPCLLMLVALRIRPTPPPIYGTLPPFALTDQAGRPFTRASLEGEVTVVNFIFTSCNQSCPRLTSQMAQIQTRLRDARSDAKLVSFSVDPEHDTPARLTEYGMRYHQDPSRWSFVTGSLDGIREVVVNGFKVLMGDAPSPRPVGFIDIVHGNQFVLVDRRARIRGYFHADTDGIDALLTQAGRLAREP